MKGRADISQPAKTALATSASPALVQDDPLGSLNEAQREAVTTTEGYVRVVAGAGTGKTRTIACRFAYLVNDLGILPGNILCVTFTNKAASEMRARIRRMIGDASAGCINTFHGLCASILREDGHALGYPKRFLVLDNADIDAMLQAVYEERGFTARDMTFAQARDTIEVMKLSEHPRYHDDLVGMPSESLHAKSLAAESVREAIFYGYLYRQKKCFGLDYNDLIVLVLRIFATDPAIRLKWQRRLEYVMVDEFQDIDGLQHRLMEALTAYHGNLFVVGDPDQTIYSWRGADVRYLLDFDKRFPRVRTIMMLDNYRSSQRVIAAANALIGMNRDRISKDLVPTRSLAGAAVWHHARSANDEAAWIVDGVRALHRAGVAYRSIAILYRAHHASRCIEDALTAAEVPHTVASGAPFFERREVKDALSYLRLLAFKDDLSFERVVNVPKRNLGRRRMAYVRDEAARRGCSLYEALRESLDADVFKGTQARQLVSLVERLSDGLAARPASDVLSSVLEESGYERMLRTEGAQDRLDNLAELKQSLCEFEASCGEEFPLEDYLARAALLSSADAAGFGADKVKLMTVHAAKGLEFDHVFLCSFSEGVLPSRKVRTRAGMEEERRLAFVAMTRARDGLYLTEAEGRGIEGGPRYPSRFLLDIGEGLLACSDVPEELLADARTAYALSDRWIADLERDAAFGLGERVRHPAFGIGTVDAVDEAKRAYVVRFDGLDTPRAISFRAKLSRA